MQGRGERNHKSENKAEMNRQKRETEEGPEARRSGESSQRRLLGGLQIRSLAPQAFEQLEPTFKNRKHSP